MLVLPPFEWVAQHLQVLGWPAITYAAYRAGRFFTKIEQRALALEEHVTKAMANDLPHIQAALNAVLEAIVDLRDDFHDYFKR
jgi:hypothetical protein